MKRALLLRYNLTFVVASDRDADPEEVREPRIRPRLRRGMRLLAAHRHTRRLRLLPQASRGAPAARDSPSVDPAARRPQTSAPASSFPPLRNKHSTRDSALFVDPPPSLPAPAPETPCRLGANPPPRLRSCRPRSHPPPPIRFSARPATAAPRESRRRDRTAAGRPALSPTIPMKWLP